MIERTAAAGPDGLRDHYGKPDDGFRWYYSFDEEDWTIADSREDAIAKGRQAYSVDFYICEARADDLSDEIFDADEVIDAFVCRNENVLTPVMAPCQCADDAKIALEAALNAAFAKWRARYTDWQPGVLAEDRNKELVPNWAFAGAKSDA